MALEKLTQDVANISKLDNYPPDDPGMTPDKLKQLFDKGSVTIKDYINNVLIPQLEVGYEALNGIGQQINDLGARVDQIITTPITSEAAAEEVVDARGTFASLGARLNGVDSQLADIEQQIYEIPKGKSAYEIAVDNGYIGTEEQWLASLAQGSPEYANSIEECTDTSKLYVLPDGYIYAYIESYGINYTNLADIQSSDWLTDYRLSTSSTSPLVGHYVTNYIPCQLGDIIRVKGLNIDTNIASSGRLHVTDANKTLVAFDTGYVFQLIDAGVASKEGDVITVPAGKAYIYSDSAVSEFSNTAYTRFCGPLMDGYSLEDVVITVNEEIDETISYKWANTGHAFVPADYEDRIVELETETANHEARLKLLEANTDGNGIPSYWLEELESKADAIQQAMEAAGRNKSAFLWYTDAHWQTNSKMSPSLLKYLIKNTSINKVNFGGDVVGDPYPFNHDNVKYVYEWRSMISGLPNHHSVYGNHDVAHRTIDVAKIAYTLLLAPEESSDMVIGGDSYYYIDNPAEKTRYLYLSYLTNDHNEMVAQGQFIIDAITGVGEGWHIVVISHRWFQYYSVSAPTEGFVPNFEQDILNVLDEYNARTTHTGSNYFSAQDFTDCKGKVEFCIGGHIHVDYDFTTDGGIPVIITAPDTNQERISDTTLDCGTIGTITESAVYGIIADYNDSENTKITVVGVGRGTSRVITPKATAVNLFDKNDADVFLTGRFNSSKAVVAYAEGQLVTGYIEAKVGDTFTIVSDKSAKTNGYTGEAVIYDTNKAIITMGSQKSVSNQSGYWSWSDDNMTGTLTILPTFWDTDMSGTAWIRFCVAYTDIDSIVINKN